MKPFWETTCDGHTFSSTIFFSDNNLKSASPSVWINKAAQNKQTVFKRQHENKKGLMKSYQSEDASPFLFMSTMSRELSVSFLGNFKLKKRSQRG